MLTGPPKRIVFIGHDASLSGAPILLLQLLLLLKQQENIGISLVIHRGGPLEDAYRQHFDVLVLKPQGYGKEKNLFERLKGILANRLRMLSFLRKVSAADMVFSNTIVNGKLIRKIARFKKPLVTYVHELGNVIREYKRSGDADYPGLEDGVIAYPSLKVKETVLASYSVGEDHLSRLSYYFPFTQEQQLKTNAAKDFRTRFGISENVFLVGGMGVACNRKGTDLFIEVCVAVTQAQANIKFCWIGVFETPEDERLLRKMVAEHGLEDKIIFTGPMPHNYYNLAAFDIFFLSSREDPYPLVVTEAAFMEVPAICFAPSGGITEFIGDDAGWIVPGFSVQIAAETILQSAANKEEIYRKGRLALGKAMQLHANPALILQQFRGLLSMAGLR